MHTSPQTIARLVLAVVSLGGCFLCSEGRAEEARLLRFPTLNRERVVFGYAGDLYIVSGQGGLARRLTSDPNSYEMFPRFSPDGKHLAFTAQYDGNTEVYVMPSEGGEPKRLTFTATLDRDDVSDRMGPNNIVMTWRDNETVVYRSRRNQWNAFKGELTLAKINGGISRRLVQFFTRRQATGLQPRLSRIPHLEALPRRTGRRDLAL
jgi:tricorn protease